ncbi:hypothetical protein GYMLUDRAFT_248825 [Collybiopsis luxurians FD-317 M1]|uniref:Uncharacterized protein n=1 Tax=Collybiopsis luxurians FD-317 M1 TaxID=944289 RepID=A0A0D0BKG7_9AGAR|nr:hypothetical protein GYMLUDRAFT_248825 [Collybiopsis luxurians FD-317 M1]
MPSQKNKVLNDTLESKEQRLVALRQEVELCKQKSVRPQNKAQSDCAQEKKEKEILSLEAEIAAMRSPSNNGNLVARDLECPSTSIFPSSHNPEPNLNGQTQKLIEAGTSASALKGPLFPTQVHENGLVEAQNANYALKETLVGKINNGQPSDITADAVPGQFQTEEEPETSVVAQNNQLFQSGGSKKLTVETESTNEALKGILPQMAETISIDSKHLADGQPNLEYGPRHEERSMPAKPDEQNGRLFLTSGDGIHATDPQNKDEGPKPFGPNLKPDQNQEIAGSEIDIASHVGQILDQAIFGGAPSSASVTEANTQFSRFSIPEPQSSEGRALWAGWRYMRNIQSVPSELPVSSSSTNEEGSSRPNPPATPVENHLDLSTAAQLDVKSVFTRPNPSLLPTFPAQDALPARMIPEAGVIIEDSVLTSSGSAIAEGEFSRMETAINPAVLRAMGDGSVALSPRVNKVVESEQGKFHSNDDHVNDKLTELFAIAKANGLTLIPFKTEDNDEVDIAAFVQASADASKKKPAARNGGKRTRKRKNAKIEDDSNQLVEGIAPTEDEEQHALGEGKVPAKKRKINQDDEEYGPEMDAEEDTEALKASKSTGGDAGSAKGSRKKIIEYEEKVALARDISNKREAEEAIQEFLVKGTKIDPTLKNLMQEVNFFVTECGSICKELSLEILTTKFGTTQCLNHHNTRNSEVNDWNAVIGNRPFSNFIYSRLGKLVLARRRS